MPVFILQLDISRDIQKVFCNLNVTILVSLHKQPVHVLNVNTVTFGDSRKRKEALRASQNIKFFSP